MMKRIALWVIVSSVVVPLGAYGAPIKVSDTDRRYFSWRGDERVQLIGYDYPALLTSDRVDAELTKGTSSRKPDYQQFIDSLVANGVNFTRCSVTTAPPEGRYPWVRADGPEGGGGGRTWYINLEEWDEVFWSRARAILDYASDRGVVVQICLTAEEDLKPDSSGRGWALHPFNPANNLPGTMGAWMLPDGLESGVPAAYDLSNQVLVDVYDAYLTKWVEETQGLDNVILEVGHGSTAGPRFHRWVVDMLRQDLKCPFLISTNALSEADRVYALSGVDVIADQGPRTPFTTKARVHDWQRFQKPIIICMRARDSANGDTALALASLQTALDLGAHVSYLEREREGGQFLGQMRDLKRSGGADAKWRWPTSVLEGDEVRVTYDRTALEQGIYLRRANKEESRAIVSSERGRWCVANPPEGSGHTLCFAIDPDAFGQGPLSLGVEATVYLEAPGDGSMTLRHATQEDPFGGEATVPLRKGRWETVNMTLRDVVLGGRQHGEADLELSWAPEAARLLVHRIVARVVEAPHKGGATATEIVQFGVSPKGERFVINGKGTFLCGLTEGHVGGDRDPVYWNAYEPEVSYADYAAQLQRWSINWIRINGISMVEGSGRADGTNVLPGERASASPPQPPYTRRPWARSGGGIAWDGLPRYDLFDFDPWYFQRLDEFVTVMNQHGIIVEFTLFHQGCLAQEFAHWADSPWRPENNSNALGLPSMPVCYPEFYDLTNERLVAAQTAYVDRVVEVLGKHPGVIYRIAEEYNGPGGWVTHWARRIANHPSMASKPVLQVGASLEVTRVLAGMDEIQSLDMSFFGVLPDGTISTPASYRDVPVAGHCPPQFHQGAAIGATLSHLYLRWTRAYVGSGDPTVDGFLRALTGGAAGWFYQSVPKEGLDPAGAKAAAAIVERTGDLSGWQPSPAIVQKGQAQCVGLSGKGYLLYITDATGLTVNLPAFAGGYSVAWFEPAKGKWSTGTGIEGGRATELKKPTPETTVLLAWPGMLQ